MNFSKWTHTSAGLIGRLSLGIGAVWLAASTTPMQGAARISEPDTIFFGQVVERFKDRQFPLSSGELVWTLRTTGTTPKEYRLTCQLGRLGDGSYSYKLKIPHEVLAYDLAVNPSAVPLNAAGTRLEHVSITLNGAALTVQSSAVAGVAIDASKRAGAYQINLALTRPSTDSDADGVPDWWEDQYGMDKWDPTDGVATSGIGGGGTTGTGGTGQPSTFEAWHQLWFPNSSVNLNTAAELDTDGDGISNVLEYAFDLNPTAVDSATAAAIPSAIRADGLLGLAFRKRVGATDLEYRVEMTGDLMGWADVTDSLRWSTDGSGVTTATTTTPADGGSGVSSRFFRLRVIRH
jgi:hypothetical protein